MWTFLKSPLLRGNVASRALPNAAPKRAPFRSNMTTPYHPKAHKKRPQAVLSGEQAVVNSDKKGDNKNIRHERQRMTC